MSGSTTPAAESRVRQSELTDEDIDEMMLVNVKSHLLQNPGGTAPLQGAGRRPHHQYLIDARPRAVRRIRSAYRRVEAFSELDHREHTGGSCTRHTRIQVSLVLPGVVATEFGLQARHGSSTPATFRARKPPRVAQVIADVIESRRADVYTRPDGQQMVARYYACEITG